MAGVVVALLGVASLAAFGRVTTFAGPALSDLAEVEFARGLLQQIEVMGPGIPWEGIYEERFQYRVTASEERSLQPTRFDAVIRLVRVTVEVTDLRLANGPTTLSQIMAVGREP